MNKPITELKKTETEHGHKREFSVFFNSDPSYEDWDIAMKYKIDSVNRQTGEIKFSLE